MTEEVVIKKIDNEYLAFIPALGVLEKSSSADSAYELACEAAQKARKAYENLGLAHILNSTQDSISVRIWDKKSKRFFALSLVVILVAISLLGLTVSNSLKRATESLKSNIFDSSPNQMEKNREKFRQLLEKYRPFIEDWQKATEKK